MLCFPRAMWNVPKSNSHPNLSCTAEEHVVNKRPLQIKATKISSQGQENRSLYYKCKGDGFKRKML